MMDPMPVDLSKLKGILGNAKQLIKKVDNNDYSTGHINAEALTESGAQRLAESGYRPTQQPVSNINHNTEERLANSKMPEAVKQMMRDNPPVQMDLSSLELSGLEDLIEKPYEISTHTQRAPIKENVTRRTNDSDMITISKAELNEMINKAVDSKLLEFMTQTFTKNLSETVITKTVSTLIKEGKIQVKKKTV